MFLKALPLDLNNHNYLHSVVMANINIRNTEKEIVTETITEDYTNSDGIIDLATASGQLFYAKIVLFMLLVVIVGFIINSLIDIVKRASCSKTLSEKTPLLKSTNKPQKMV